MSSIELKTSPAVNSRRKEITNIDAQLRDLNLRFPGERNKPECQKNPIYNSQRSGILARRQRLSGMQGQHRRALRRE